MKILISNRSKVPIYAQIRDQIKEQILDGSLMEGTTLPSIRQLAKELGISVITTTRAYKDLEDEGFIISMQGKGSVVLSADNSMVLEQYYKKIEEGLLMAIENAAYARISHQELVTLLERMLKEQEPATDDGVKQE